MKIIAIPYAGATAKVFLPLKSRIEGKNSFVGLDLPGHGSLCDQDCKDSIYAMAKYIFDQIVDEIEEEDYCILGYCMGSWVTIELYYLLKENSKKLPQSIFFLATNLEQLQVEQVRYQDMGKDELIEKLKMENQLPVEVIENKEILEFVLPIIRSDLIAVENYKINQQREKIATQGVIIFSGEDEVGIHNWDKIFEDECDYYQVDGAHLLLEDSYEEAADILNRKLANLVEH